MLRWLLRVVLLGVLVTLWWNPLWHEVPRNVLEDSTLGVAVRAEVPRLEENGTFEAPNHTRRAEKPQRVERNRSQDHPANVSGKCSSGHQGGAGRCTSSTECEAERFCHQEHSTCEPFCISSYGRSELQMKRCSGCLKSCGARCHGFIEERKALREGSCAKRLLLRSCQQCKEACQELPEEMPIRFPEDEPRVADVWITSYPKAGSTWVRHLITNLHFAVEGQRRPASFKEVDDFIPFIEDGQGWTSRTMFRDRQGLRFWKSHSPFHCDTFPCKGHVVARQGPSQCMCPNCAAKFRRVVYIYRNGYNTMASYFRFRLGLGHLRDRRNFGTFVNDRRMYPGTSWADHVRSWQHAEQRGVKIFWLRYEALEEHTEAELQRLAQFLGLKAEEEHLSLAVNASSASTMQEMEHTEGGLNFFKLRYNRSSLKFVSSGQGNMATKRLWQDVSEEVLRTWRQHNGPTMRCLGYPDAPMMGFNGVPLAAFRKPGAQSAEDRLHDHAAPTRKSRVSQRHVRCRR